MVDAATGEELDFTVDSPSVNGEKMEVFLCALSIVHGNVVGWH